MANIGQHLNKLDITGRDTYQLVVVAHSNYDKQVNLSKAKI